MFLSADSKYFYIARFDHYYSFFKNYSCHANISSLQHQSISLAVLTWLSQSAEHAIRLAGTESPFEERFAGDVCWVVDEIACALLPVI